MNLGISDPWEAIIVKFGDLVVFRKAVCIIANPVSPTIWWICLILPQGLRLVVHKEAVRLIDEDR